jgi:hypothetical protein
VDDVAVLARFAPDEKWRVALERAPRRLFIPETAWASPDRYLEAESWAAVDDRPGAARFGVEQYGPRRLWDEAETAYLGWLRAGRPGLERLGVSVTTSGDQRFWLDSPDHSIG